MSVILGVDLGTQSLKAMLLDTQRGILCTHGEGYELSFPKVDWAEEDPESWWNALKTALSKIKAECPKEFAALSVIGLCGQMHGMVPLDQGNRPVMPAIIWVDQRSKRQVREIEESYAFSELASVMHNRIFTGFALPSLLWMKEECPSAFAKVRKICSPKDYLRMRLVGGEAETDVSDASSMTGFDFARRKWNESALEELGLDPRCFPMPHESTEIAGTVQRPAAEKTGLPLGIPVVYGSGDAAALAMGCGMYREGIGISNIGTGGNFTCYSAKDVYDAKLRMQEFCGAVDRSYILSGAMLSGGLSMSWLRKNVLGIQDYDVINEMAASVAPGSEGLIFLPYLGGERTPHMDLNACGNFFGLRHVHRSAHLCRAVMEGVTFALRDAQLILEENAAPCEQIIAAGGGAKSPLWLQIQADIFNREMVVSDSGEEACLGACLIAGLGIKLFSDAEEACRTQVHLSEKRYTPIERNVEVYRRQYEIYRQLYPCLKNLMRQNSELILQNN